MHGMRNEEMLRNEDPRKWITYYVNNEMNKLITFAQVRCVFCDNASSSSSRAPLRQSFSPQCSLASDISEIENCVLFRSVHRAVCTHIGTATHSVSLLYRHG